MLCKLSFIINNEGVVRKSLIFRKLDLKPLKTKNVQIMPH